MGPPPGIFAELSRWRDKAIKRGKETDFTSDIIPGWLHDQVLEAQKVYGPEATFSFLKQVPLSVRMKAEREIKRKIQAILSKYERRAARAIKRGEQFDYAGMADELRAAVMPEISNLVLDSAMRLSVDTGIAFDPSIINTEALRWARSFSTDWANALTETTRKQLQEAMSAFVQTPGLTIGDITKLIEPAFGPVRSEMIAITETTRAYSMATNQTQELLQAETPELTVTRVWNTMQDERVCFPAWTMVETDKGPRPIQKIKPGEWVLTGIQYMQVLATSKQEYSGPMMRIETENQAVEATANHPFWTAEKGFLRAGDLEAGYTLNTSNWGTTKVLRAVGFVFDNPISVYNLEVKGIPEFHANGILVHNCPICGPLEGAPEDKWSSVLQGPLENGASIGQLDVSEGPPAHPRCILPGNVVAVPGLIGGAKSQYIGGAVEICTALGRVLTVTQNHPILTRHGWVAAKNLSQGDDVIVCANPERIASTIYPDYDHVPAAIEQVFGALEMSGFVGRGSVPAAAKHLHGDGRRVDGDINIIRPHRFLLGDIESRLEELLSESGFDRSNIGRPMFLRGGPLALFGPGNNAPTGRLMSSRDLIRTALWGHTGPLEPFGFGASTSFDSIVAQNAGDDAAADIELAREFLGRFASLVSLDKISLVRQFDFSGHVYDLQSGIYGLYIVNGVLSSNCRCSTSIRFEAPEDLEKDFGRRQREREKWLTEQGLKSNHHLGVHRL